MKKKIITGTVVAAVLCAVLIPRLLGSGQFAQAVSPPIMEAEQPVIEDIKLATSLIDKIGPSGVVYIYPKTSGGVTAVNVKAGDIVAQRQMIYTIDTKQVKTAKGSMDSAELSLKQAREELARQQISYSSGGISDQEYGQHRDNVTNAEISYNQAKYSYETQMEYSQITAPIDRLMEIYDMEPYDTVPQNNPICIISGRGNKMVSFSATERIRGYLQEEDTVQMEKGDGSYRETICGISTVTDETTKLYKVKAGMDKGTFLSTGSEVKLYMTSEEAANAMTIPVDAAYYGGEEPYVYVYTDGRVHKGDIGSGIYDSNTMKVRSGLTLDGQVVTIWNSELYEGTEAILKNQEEDGQ